MGKMRQKYHLEPDRGLLNDPNGLSYFQGKYYVFFQWNRFAKDHSYKEWGLFRSADLLHWDFEGSALLPDQTYDKDGVYSGSACVIDGRLCLYYTGNTKTDGKREVHQCLAVTSEGRKYLKYGSVLDTPKGYTQHFRDPKIFRGRSQDYFMLVGAQRTCGKGAVAIARSSDGLHWKAAGDLARTQQYEMIECPDLFELDGRHVLLFNPQERDNVKDTCGVSFSAYKITGFDEKAVTLDDPDLDRYERLDQGFDFYSPQTFCDGRGRRLLCAWMSRMEGEDEKIFAADEKNIHCLTLPRELHVKNGKLYQNVPEEYEQLKGSEISAETAGDGRKEAVFPERTSFIRLSGEDLNCGMSVSFPDDGTQIRYDAGTKSFTLKRYRWTDRGEEEKSFHLDSLREVEMWQDQSSVEIFINGGEYVMSARIYVREDGGQRAVFEKIAEDVKIECREICLV